MRIAARAPNHLGDGVLALPALAALSRLAGGDPSRFVISAPSWGADLYRDLAATLRPRGTLPPVDAAVLFPPSLRAAIEARFARRRVGTATDHRRLLLTDVVAEGPHRFDTYRALAGALGAQVSGPPCWRWRETDPQVRVPEGHIGLNPVSVSGAVREWPHFAALAERLDEPVVVYGGPGERQRVVERAADEPVVVYGGPGERQRVVERAAGRPVRVGLTLPAFASALRRCALFVSNDSGAAHFARALGVPVLVLYGSTRPERTGPLGSDSIIGPERSCAPCYGRRCRYGLECFEIEVDRVLARIAERVGR